MREILVVDRRENGLDSRLLIMNAAIFVAVDALCRRISLYGRMTKEAILGNWHHDVLLFSRRVLLSPRRKNEAGGATGCVNDRDDADG